MARVKTGPKGQNWECRTGAINNIASRGAMELPSGQRPGQCCPRNLFSTHVDAAGPEKPAKSREGSRDASHPINTFHNPLAASGETKLLCDRADGRSEATSCLLPGLGIGSACKKGAVLLKRHGCKIRNIHSNE